MVKVQRVREFPEWGIVRKWATVYEAMEQMQNGDVLEVICDNDKEPPAVRRAIYQKAIELGWKANTRIVGLSIFIRRSEQD